jgi:hypothetical protein
VPKDGGRAAKGAGSSGSKRSVTPAESKETVSPGPTMPSAVPSP